MKLFNVRTVLSNVPFARSIFHISAGLSLSRLIRLYRVQIFTYIEVFCCFFFFLSFLPCCFKRQMGTDVTLSRDVLNRFASYVRGEMALFSVALQPGAIY